MAKDKLTEEELLKRLDFIWDSYIDDCLRETQEMPGELALQAYQQLKEMIQQKPSGDIKLRYRDGVRGEWAFCHLSDLLNAIVCGSDHDLASLWHARNYDFGNFHVSVEEE
jgi:hypothetical protein